MEELDYKRVYLFQKSTRSTRILNILSIFIIFVSNIIVIETIFLHKYPQPDHTSKSIFLKSNTSPYPFDTAVFDKGYSVGKIKINLLDLENEFKLNYSNTPDNRNSIQNWQNTANILTTKAIIQNEGITLNLYSASDSLQLDPKKINQTQKYLDQQGVSYINGEEITVWYDNMYKPPMGIAQAKIIAYNTISKLYLQIIAGKMTLKEAGDYIKSDTDLAQIDPAYQNNAYIAFTAYQEPPFFIDPQLNQKLWSMKENSISEILTGHDLDNNNKSYDDHFAIIKVNKKVVKQFSSVTDLVNARLKETPPPTLKPIK
jgi:hypothetical protein